MDSKTYRCLVCSQLPSKRLPHSSTRRKTSSAAVSFHSHLLSLAPALQVWARGFAAALLARSSAATRLASLRPPADPPSPTHIKSRGATAKATTAAGAWQPRRLPSAADLVAVGDEAADGGKHFADQGLEGGKDGRQAAIVADEEEALAGGESLMGEWDDRREAEAEKRKVAEGWEVVRNRHGVWESVLVFVFRCIAAVLLPMPNSRR